MSYRFGFKRAICYSGFRDGQSPDLGKYPSVEEIRSDLMMLKDHWSALRLHACDEHARRGDLKSKARNSTSSAASNSQL